MATTPYDADHFLVQHSQGSPQVAGASISTLHGA
jgi:hypothetical protein